MLSDCFREMETDYEGNDIHIEKMEGKDSLIRCGDLCAATEGCLFWTLLDADKGKSYVCIVDCPTQLILHLYLSVE